MADFDFAAFQKLARLKIVAPLEQVELQLKLRSKRVVAQIRLPIQGTAEWLELQERY